MRIAARPVVAILVVLGVVAAAVASTPRATGAQPSSIVAADDATPFELGDDATPPSIDIVAPPDVPIATRTSPPRNGALRSTDILAAAPKTSPPRGR